MRLKPENQKKYPSVEYKATKELPITVAGPKKIEKKQSKESSEPSNSYNHGLLFSSHSCPRNNESQSGEGLENIPGFGKSIHHRDSDINQQSFSPNAQTTQAFFGNNQNS